MAGRVRWVGSWQDCGDDGALTRVARERVPGLFAGLPGDAYRQLPPAVRECHDASPPERFAGRAMVVPARGILARLLARAARLPIDAGEAPIIVTVVASGSGQRWSRQFDIG